MTRQLLILVIIAAASVLSAFLPVEYFVSDAFRPPPNKVLTPEGIATVAYTPIWLYFWRIEVVYITLLFAAIVATFFVKPNPRTRWTLAMLSIAAAFFHYLALLFTSSPPGYGISLYPLVYTISIKNVTQYYLDIGQILMIYAAYNVYMAKRLS